MGRDIDRERSLLHPRDRPRRYLIHSVERACDILALLRSSDEPLKLSAISSRVGLSPPTAFRILDTLCYKDMVERPGRCGYRIAGLRPLRVGYAAQSSEFSFSRAVGQSISEAAQAARLGLLVLDNRYSRRTALRNADYFVRTKVDLAIEFQTFAEIAFTVASKYHAAGIPMIAVEIPHPGATYYGADNYRAGQLGGRCLGRWAKKHWGGQVDEVLLVELWAAGALPQLRLTGTLDGLIEVLPGTADSSIVHLNGNGQFHASLVAVRKHLRGVPPRKTLVAAVNDPSAIGALRAFEEAGRENDCAGVGQNGSEEARDEMRRRGTRLVGSVAYFPETYGPGIISLALDVLNHRPVQPAVFTRHHLVTPENVGHAIPGRIVPPRRSNKGES